MSKKIMILGGFGFMGKNLNHLLKESSYTVINESRRTWCDLMDPTVTLRKLYDHKPDIIINAAAHVGSIGYVNKYSSTVVHENSMMYLNLYRAVNDVVPGALIINPISNCSYPGNADIQKEDEWWNGPIHPSVESYGTPKKLGYILSKCYRQQHGVKTFNLIMANSYGENDYLDENKTHAMNGIIMRMIKAKNNGDKKFVVWGTGTPIREWLYMPDMARFIKKLIDDGIEELPDPINIGQEFGISIKDTVLMIKEFLEYDVEIEYDLTKMDGAPKKILSKELFSKVFPDFKFTGYSVGIQNTISYYNKELK